MFTKDLLKLKRACTVKYVEHAQMHVINNIV